MEQASFGELLSKQNLDELSARDQRYDLVIHLVSASRGAESFYTSANNAARFESLEEARKQDEATPRPAPPRLASWAVAQPAPAHVRCVTRSHHSRPPWRRRWAQARRARYGARPRGTC